MHNISSRVVADHVYFLGYTGNEVQVITNMQDVTSNDAKEGEVIPAELNRPCPSFFTGFSLALFYFYSALFVFIGLSKHITCHFNTATCDVHG